MGLMGGSPFFDLFLRLNSIERVRGECGGLSLDMEIHTFRPLSLLRRWLKEHYGEEYTERTVSRYVQGLREKYQLKKERTCFH